MSKKRKGPKKPTRKSPRSYEVGYGKPPKHSQFRPGQSGNPKGKRKGAKNFDTILHEILHRKLSVRDRGSIRQVTLIEAMLLKFAEGALRGDPKAAAFLLGRYAPPAAEEGGDGNLSREDQEILDAFARRIRSTPKKGSGQ